MKLKQLDSMYNIYIYTYIYTHTHTPHVATLTHTHALITLIHGYDLDQKAGVECQIDRRIAARITGSLQFLDGESYTGGNSFALF